MRPDSGDMPRSRPAYAFGQPVAGIAPAPRERSRRPRRRARLARQSAGWGMKRRAASRWCSGPRRPRCCAPRRAPGTVRSTWPNPAGRHLATAGYDGQVLLWDPATGRPRHVLEGDGSAMWSVAVSRDGTSLVAVTMDGAAHLWDIGTAVEVCRLRVDGHLSACSFHPYGHRVVLGGSAGLYACEISPDAVDDR
ncbi:hypothetical protein FNV68_52630 [Streptomyces sp. S1D4-23]|nr:hypothetical protein FNV61_51570 [Streptomyces sp. RLB3-6]QDO13608.1 hypothetical protein FNV68_52630 [Streptomyces sp. S1D4-23]